jgi:hypothetical protein
VYEVSLAIDGEVLADYRAWLADHVAGIAALPGFTGATTWDVVDPAPPSGVAHLCVQYALRDPAALDAYLRDHAPRLRADGIARFGDRVRATRRVLHAA